MQRGSIENNEQRVRLYRMVEFIGRWSMVDVFVDTFTAALVQLQPLMSVEPAPGLFFFAAVVVLTMLAVESFDPRLIWDSAERRERSDMPDRDTPLPPRPRVADASPRRRTRLSLVWIIPIVAALVGAWVAVTRILSEGPKITIVFHSAEGLEAGKTKIHYNGVDVGTLTTIRLSDDHQQRDRHRADGAEDRGLSRRRHEVLGGEAAHLRRQRVGLGTLISGAYIGMEIGQSNEAQARLRGARHAAGGDRRHCRAASSC